MAAAHVPGEAEARRHVVVVVAEEVGAVVAQAQVEHHVGRYAPLVLRVEAHVLVVDVEIERAVGIGRQEEEARRRLLEAEAVEEILVARDRVGEEEVGGVLDVVGHFFEAGDRVVVQVPAEAELVVAAPPMLVPGQVLRQLEAPGRAVVLAAEGRAGLQEAAAQQDQDGLETPFALQVAAQPPLDQRRRALQEQVGAQHPGVAEDAGIGGALDGALRAGQGDGAQQGELIPPATSSSLRLAWKNKRWLGFRFQSSLIMPLRRSVTGAIPKSSSPPGVARPFATNAGIWIGRC